MVARDGGCYGRPFKRYWGVTQWGPVSPTIFNTVVDTVVWAMLQEVCGPQEAQHALGWVEGDQDIVFYAEDVCIAGRNPTWVQGKLKNL